MPTTAFIGVRVTPEMKALVRRLAEKDGMTESKLVKQLLELVLRTSILGDIQMREPTERVHRQARLYVRLDADDRALLAGRAKERGMPAATYISALVRSHLRNLAPLPKDELLALKRSIAELRVLGSNLNQMSRILNQGGSAVPGSHEVMSMLKVAEGLRSHFRALLVANEKSWGNGYAEESR